MDPVFQSYQEFVKLFPTVELGHRAIMTIGQQIAGAEQVAAASQVASKEVSPVVAEAVVEVVAEAVELPVAEVAQAVAEKSAFDPSVLTAMIQESVSAALATFAGRLGSVESAMMDATSQIGSALQTIQQDQVALKSAHAALKGSLEGMQNIMPPAGQLQAQRASVQNPLIQSIFGSGGNSGTATAQQVVKQVQGPQIDPLVLAVFGGN